MDAPAYEYCLSAADRLGAHSPIHQQRVFKVVMGEFEQLGVDDTVSYTTFDYL